MHMQIRCHPVASPPDVDMLLGRLAEGGVNLVAVGGSDVEFGGEFAFVPEDGQEELAKGVLNQWEYPYREVFVDDPDSGLHLCMASHETGGLHRCLEQAAALNTERGWKIRDVLIGVPDEDQFRRKIIPVHVYSEPESAAQAD
jgi:hypothetical protein